MSVLDFFIVADSRDTAKRPVISVFQNQRKGMDASTDESPALVFLSVGLTRLFGLRNLPDAD